MVVTDKHILAAFIIIIVLLCFTLYNINTFVKSEKKCESGFGIINKCKCIPDENFAKLLNYPNYVPQIEINEVNSTR